MPDILGPSLELQIAIVEKIRASTDLQGLLGKPVRIYQDAPTSPTFPYVTLGDGDENPDIADCIDGTEVYLSLHVWSKEDGFEVCKKTVATIWNVLRTADISLTQNTLSVFERDSAHYLRDPSYPIKHGVLTLRALTEPA